MGMDCCLGVTEEEEGESTVLLLDRPNSSWEVGKAGSLAEESMEETEEELLCFPTLFFCEIELQRISTEPFPLDSPFCFAV